MAIGDTRPSHELLNKRNPDVYNTRDVQRGLASLGAAIDDLRQRDEQTKRFSTLTNLSRLQGQMNQEFVDMVNNADPTGLDFDRKVRDWTQERRKQFMMTVPPELQEEMAYRYENLSQNFALKGLETKIGLQEDYFDQSMDEQLTAALTDLHENPGSLDQWRAHMTDMINAAPVSPRKKAAAAYAYGQSMLSMTFLGELEQGFSANPTSIPTEGSVVDQLILIESGGNPNAKNPNSSAAGLGQYIDSSWLEAVQKYRPDVAEGKSDEEILALRVGKENSEFVREIIGYDVADYQKFLQENGVSPTPGDIYLVHFLGRKGAMQILRADGQTKLSEVADPEVIKANASVKLGDKSFADFTVADLRVWANGKMAGSELPEGTQVASAIPNIWTDPTYAPLEADTKLRLYNDALATVKQQSAQAEAEHKAQQERSYAELSLRIDQGDTGLEQTIAEARINGDITLEHYDKLLKRLGDSRTFIADGVKIKNWLDKGHVFVGTDEEKNGLNALFNISDGRKKLAEADSEYVLTTLLPIVSKTNGLVPSQAATMLGQMMASGSAQQTDFAARSLQNIFAIAPRAVHQFSEEVVNDAMIYATALPYSREGEMLELLKKRRDPAYAATFNKVFEEGQKKAVDFTPGKITNLMASYFKIRDNYAPPETIRGNDALLTDFRTLFALNYAKTSDVDIAANAAATQLATVWGPDPKGKKLMKYAPEKAGLPQINYEGNLAKNLFGTYSLSGYDWMDWKMRARYDLPEDTEFEYLSLAGTGRRIAEGRPIPYIVVYKRPGFTDWTLLGDTGIEEFTVTPMMQKLFIDSEKEQLDQAGSVVGDWARQQMMKGTQE